VDTSFVIDLIRERSRGSGRATKWLNEHVDNPMAVSMFVLCELEAGAQGSLNPERERRRRQNAPDAVGTVLVDDRFAAKYGEVLNALQRRGRTIGDMDLLIATTALVNNASLVTGNEKHFHDIPDLRVLSYR